MAGFITSGDIAIKRADWTHRSEGVIIAFSVGPLPSTTANHRCDAPLCIACHHRVSFFSYALVQGVVKATVDDAPRLSQSQQAVNLATF